jgi:hypothetical protein
MDGDRPLGTGPLTQLSHEKRADTEVLKCERTRSGPRASVGRNVLVERLFEGGKAPIEQALSVQYRYRRSQATDRLCCDVVDEIARAGRLRV